VTVLKRLPAFLCVDPQKRFPSIGARIEHFSIRFLDCAGAALRRDEPQQSAFGPDLPAAGGQQQAIPRVRTAAFQGWHRPTAPDRGTSFARRKTRENLFPLITERAASPAAIWPLQKVRRGRPPSFHWLFSFLRHARATQYPGSRLASANRPQAVRRFVNSPANHHSRSRPARFLFLTY